MSLLKVCCIQFITPFCVNIVSLRSIWIWHIRSHFNYPCQQQHSFILQGWVTASLCKGWHGDCKVVWPESVERLFENTRTCLEQQRYFSAFTPMGTKYNQNVHTTATVGCVMVLCHSKMNTWTSSCTHLPRAYIHTLPTSLSFKYAVLQDIECRSKENNDWKRY